MMNTTHVTTLFLLFIFSSSLSYGQVDTSSTKYDISGFYILDQAWFPRRLEKYDTDDSPNYIQMEDGYALVCSRYRNRSILIEGEIDGLEVVENKDRKTTSFFIRGKVWSIGKILSIKITEKKNGEITILIYEKLGMGEVYFSAHHASTSEVKAIVEYWNR